MELKNFFAQDTAGNVIPTPSAYVYAPGTTTLATGLVDKDGAALGNPFTGTAQGQIQFAAPGGDYDLRVLSGLFDYTIRVRFADETITPEQVTPGIYSINITGNAATATTSEACTGNAATATTSAACTGNAATVTNGVYTSGNQTIAGTKTFSSPIAGSVTGSSASCTGNAASATTAAACTGNAATVTNGVYTVGEQTIGGVKTFSSAPKTTAIQLGDSATATQNFTLRSNADGSATLARGNVGATTQDVLTIDAAGKVVLPAGNEMLGVGQTWQTVTGSRASGTTYYNTTGKPIQVIIHGTNDVNTNWAQLQPTVGGVALPAASAIQNQSRVYLSFLVPVGASYSVTNSGTTVTIVQWSELR